MTDFDVILAGGGLANGLIALALAKRRPDVRVAIFESNATLGGEHTWSFHGTDVSAADMELLAPMIRTSWADQEVRFPGFRRRLTSTYHAITSDAFHDTVAAAGRSQTTHFNARIDAVHRDRIVLEGGRVITAQCVIDGRGWNAKRAGALALAYQKFAGLEVELAVPHDLEMPIIMDATVEQTDGYRFMYCLPFSAHHMLIEDTYYSTTAALDRGKCADQIMGYAKAKGWSVERIVRREAGCLPIVLAGDCDGFIAQEQEAPMAGLRGGLFHPTTGYSLPSALKLAGLVADAKVLSTSEVGREMDELLRTQWQEQGFYRLLNRLLFVAARGEERRKVMQRFYRLPQDKIERFYAGQSTSLDKLRIVSGWPPIPLPRAVAAVPSTSAWRMTS